MECDTFTGAPQKYHEGHDFIGSIYVPAKGEKTSGAMRALDPFTGQKRWEFPYTSPPWCGALSTAGGIVFAPDGTLYAASWGPARERLPPRRATVALWAWR